MTACTTCEAETADGQYLCATDRVSLYRILSRVRETLNTAGGSLTNQAVAPVNTGGTAGSSSPGMPLNLDMLDAAAHYRGIIGDWAGQVADTLGTTPPLDVLNRAAWLSKLTERIARHGWAGDMLTELQYAEQATIRAADRHAAKITLGTCHALTLTDNGGITRCQGAVTGREGQDHATCNTCHTTHSAQQRQTDAVANAWNIAAPLPDILRALKTGGHANIPQNRADKWVSLGKLEDAGTCPYTGRNLYTIAAVFDTYLKTPTGNRHYGDQQLRKVEEFSTL